MINKLFLPASKTAESEMARLYLRYGRDFSYKSTDFYRLRTGQADWREPGIANIPDSIEMVPDYWVVPWADKYRKPSSLRNKIFRRLKFPGLLSDFFSLIENIRRSGFDNSREPIKGYLFYNDSGQSRFIYTDGNRRLGILAAISPGFISKVDRVNIEPKGIFSQQSILKNSIIQANKKKYGFSDKDIMKWFHHVFEK